ncbi:MULTISPECIES: hypothetical protein [unclassified Paenibacillus]|uniref:hypothetical protein n=1 Tax=unclassified Paenibacillus TaxID=185978 RepID=UPI0021176EB8|nr:MULTISPECIES: hypothetical protein [unclassified Paenibacillus]
MDWHVIIDNWPLLSKGVWVTVEIFVYTLVLGTALGIPLGVLRNSKIAAVRLPVFGIIKYFADCLSRSLYFSFFSLRLMFFISISQVKLPPYPA